MRRIAFLLSSKTRGTGDPTCVATKLLRISNNNKENQAQIIQQSIENGWKGLFELKTEKQTKVQKILTNYQKGLEMINKEYND